MRRYQFASVYVREVIDVTADNDGKVQACSKGMGWVEMMTNRYEERTIRALWYALAYTHVGFELPQTDPPADDSSLAPLNEESRARVVDLHDRDGVMLRMVVTRDGGIIGCQGPMAFLAEGLLAIFRGHLGPSDVAELLDLESGVVEYEPGEHPPLSFVAAAVGELLKEGFGPPPTQESFRGPSQYGETRRPRRIR